MLGASAALLAGLAVWLLVDLDRDEQPRAAPPPPRSVAGPERPAPPSLPNELPPELASIPETPPASDGAVADADPSGYQSMFKRLRETGKGHAPWHAAMIAFLEGLRGDATTPDGFYAIQLVGYGCWLGGCMGYYRFDTRAELVRTQDAVERSEWADRHAYSRIDERDDHVWLMVELLPPP
jgi:hypothetical protein